MPSQSSYDLVGKVHGGLARAGKVKGQTPHVDPDEDKPKTKCGRSSLRHKYNRRFMTNMTTPFGKRIGPNSSKLKEMKENK